MSESEHNLVPLRAIGVDTGDLAPEIRPGAESERWAEEFGRSSWPRGAVRLAVHPGAGKRENIWSPERFADVVNRLSEWKTVGVVAVEGPRDREAVGAFVRACRAPVVVARGRAIADVAALLERADLVLCNDTGVMHVAVAVGANTLAVFGPTDPVRWAPRRDCLAVVRAPGGRLHELDPARVAARAQELLGLVPAGQRDV
jgi:ADP-heptose:LPS heptosyltransferase